MSSTINDFIVTLPEGGGNVPRSIFIPGSDTYICDSITLVAMHQIAIGSVELVRSDNKRTIAKFTIPGGDLTYVKIESTVQNYPSEKSVVDVIITGNVMIGSFLFSGRRANNTYSAVLSPTILSGGTTTQTVFVYPGTILTGFPMRINAAIYSISGTRGSTVRMENMDNGRLLASGSVLADGILGIANLDIIEFPSFSSRVRIIISSLIPSLLIGTIIDSTQRGRQYTIIPSIFPPVSISVGTLRPFTFNNEEVTVSSVRSCGFFIGTSQILRRFGLDSIFTVPSGLAIDEKFSGTSPIIIGDCFLELSPFMSITYTFIYSVGLPDR